MEKWIYNKNGNAVAVEAGGGIWDSNGIFRAWIDGVNLFNRKGIQIGWVEGGVYYDKENTVLGFTRGHTFPIPNDPGVCGEYGSLGVGKVFQKPTVVNRISNRPAYTGDWSSILLEDCLKQ